MKLCYYKLSKGKINFGDNLNPWLWERLIPGVLDNDQNVAFVGIGTLINEGLSRRTRRAKNRVIFSTGVGYVDSSFELDRSYKIYCVRGPLSAKALGLEKELGITDGAVLIRKVFTDSKKKLYRFSYMPHHELAGKGWELTCQKLGFGYVDPGWTIEEVLSSISQTEILLTEAMHGAIVADALRIPWIPIVSAPSILSFKWQDWCASINVEYKPTFIEKLYHPREKQDILTPIRASRDWVRQKKAGKVLRQIAMNQTPFLSQDLLMQNLTEQLIEKLNQFQQDVNHGLFKM